MISARDLIHNITEEKVQADERAAPRAISRGPSPNRGGTVPDFTAIGPDRESKKSWLQSRGIDVSKQVKLSKLSHMRYQHPDLDVITTFLKDFGMHVVKRTATQRWFRGYGPDQYVYYAQQGPKKYLGGVFAVQTYDDLERALKVPGAKVLSNGIEKIEDGPGGGFLVTLQDPEGFPVNFIYGQEALTAEQDGNTIKKKENVVWNTEAEKPRQRAFQRFVPGPAEVYKLGHFGLCVANFSTQLDFYTRHFNLIPSDILYIPSPTATAATTNGDNEPTNPKDQKVEVALFAHINLGEELTDHHTMFLTSLDPTDKSATPHVHHSSYEVHDLDTQFLGHQWLASKDYTSVWGVGRHILGSQIFDYWWDTTGFMVEHYADGDLVNVETPLAYGPAGHEGLAVWGPEVPKAFLD